MSEQDRRPRLVRVSALAWPAIDELQDRLAERRGSRPSYGAIVAEAASRWLAELREEEGAGVS